jgi:hypothetical protein
MSKNLVETEGPRMSQYGANALHAELGRLYARMRMHTPMRRVPTYTRTHARTHTHKNIEQYVIFIAFPLQQLFRERASVLRYTYIACLVLINLFKNTAGFPSLNFAINSFHVVVRNDSRNMTEPIRTENV